MADSEERLVRISFVVPTRNRAFCVAACIDSVLRQPYQAVEIIILDDASTDNLVEVMEPYADNDKVRFVRFAEHVGQNYARNRGFEKARGEFVTIIDSDDEDYGTDLQQVVDVLDAKPAIAGIFTPVVPKSDGVVRSNVAQKDTEFAKAGFLDGTCAGEYQFFLRKEKLPENFFEEGLGVKRSCTLISFVKLGRSEKFIIKDIPTRLYDDLGGDRLSGTDNIIADAEELVRGHGKMLEHVGEDMLEVAPLSYWDLHYKRAFYLLLSEGRKPATQELAKIPGGTFSIKKMAVMRLLILFGPKTAKAVRQRIGK